MPFHPFEPNQGQQPLSIPSSSSNPFGGATGSSFPRQDGIHYGGGGGEASSGSSGGGGMISGLSALMRRGNTGPGNGPGDMDMASSPSGAHSSLSSNPHSGFHPSSYGPNLTFSALALGISNPNYAAGSFGGNMGMGMSISPPNWGSMGSGSYVGSVGAFGTSLNREREGRERELEARYVRDFSCCGKRLNGLHELLEHYEEEHANLPPDVRMAAMNAVQNQPARPVASPFSHIPPTPTSMTQNQPQTLHQHHGSDVPAPPGMMDIEMDEPAYPSPHLSQQYGARTPNAATNPWAAAYRPQVAQAQQLQPQCVPPSLLSYAPPTPSGSSTGNGTGTGTLTPEQIQAKALRKAQRRAERAAREEASADDGEGEKRFVCPIEGCGKVYKQANGLKYHLTRSINSGHGNVAALGGLAALLGEKGDNED